MPFVGREAELGQIVASFERCVEDADSCGRDGDRRSRHGQDAAAARGAVPRGKSLQHSPDPLHAKRDLRQGARTRPDRRRSARAHRRREAASADRPRSTRQTPSSRRARSPAPTPLVISIARLVANEALPEIDDTQGARRAVARPDGHDRRDDEAQSSRRRARGRAVGGQRQPRVGGPPARARLRLPTLSARDGAAGVLAGGSGALRRARSRAAGAPTAFAQIRADHRRGDPGERATGERGEALADSIAQQSARTPLFAEAPRASRPPGRMRRPRRRSRPRCRCTWTPWTTSVARPGEARRVRRDRVGPRPRGHRRGRRGGSPPRPGRGRGARRAGPLAVLRDARSYRLQARPDARGRVRVARRGPAPRVPRASGPLAGERRRGRRDRCRDTLELGGNGRRGSGVSRESCAASAGGARSPGGSRAGREGARIRGGQANAVRPGAAPRRSLESPRCARRRARHRRPGDAGGHLRQGQRGARIRRPRALRGRARRRAAI